MWIKRKIDFHPVDSKTVKRDFIIAEGSSIGLYSFLDKDKNPFERSIRVPIMYIFKVHRNHPMNIFSADVNHIYIYPENELKSKNPRMPIEVYRDKMDYDLFTLMLVPFENPDIGNYWKKFEIKEAFSSAKDDSIRDVSLIYLKHGIDIHSQDALPRIGEVMPSQVLNHFYSWLVQSHDIFSNDKTFDEKLEGMVKVSLENAREITWKVANILEKRYNTRLMFDHYRERWERKEKRENNY